MPFHLSSMFTHVCPSHLPTHLEDFPVRLNTTSTISTIFNQSVALNVTRNFDSDNRMSTSANSLADLSKKIINLSDELRTLSFTHEMRFEADEVNESNEED